MENRREEKPCAVPSCCSNNSMVWIGKNTKNPFFFMERFPVLSQAWWDFQSNSKLSFSTLLQVFFTLDWSGLSLFPLLAPIYPRKWGCSGIQWEEGRSCWLYIRGLPGGSGAASRPFHGMGE